MKNKILSHVMVMTAFGLIFTCSPLNAQETPALVSSEEPTPVDFPGRSSLGEMKEATLPNLTDSVIKGPSPMGVVVSKKAPPSEQLLGRITSEVFHEMADLERGNVFLKLQTQREQLKNDLETLKAAYRQARLDEIEKRENVIRTRVEWMQEQERIRQEILEKKLQTELLEKEIEEAELREEELLKPKKEKTETSVASSEQEGTIIPEETVSEVYEEETVIAPEGLPALTILDIKGMKNRLTARLVDAEGRVRSVKVGSILPSGHVVKSIEKTEIVFEKDGKPEMLAIETFVPVKDKTETEETVEVEEVEES